MMLVIRFILNGIALGFYRLAKGREDRGNFMCKSFPRDSFGYAIGKIDLAFSDLFKEIGTALVKGVKK